MPLTSLTTVRTRRLMDTSIRLLTEFWRQREPQVSASSARTVSTGCLGRFADALAREPQPSRLSPRRWRCGRTRPRNSSAFGDMVDFLRLGLLALAKDSLAKYRASFRFLTRFLFADSSTPYLFQSVFSIPHSPSRRGPGLHWSIIIRLISGPTTWASGVSKASHREVLLPQERLM